MSFHSCPDFLPVLNFSVLNVPVLKVPRADHSRAYRFRAHRSVLIVPRAHRSPIHIVFRICDIKPMDENHRLFQVDLTLTTDNDKDLRVLTDHIREETFSDSEGWHRLDLVLLKMGQSNKAEEVYEILLEQATEESKKAPIYHQMGCVKYNQRGYKEAITFYEKSLEIQQQSLPSNHSDLAMSYNNIGNMYFKMGEYSKALSSHEKALEIRQQSLPPNHPDLGHSHSNIGLVYENISEYSKARSFYERAVDIGQKSLPSNHPILKQRQTNLDRVKKKL